MQRQCEHAPVAGKDGRGAVAMVHVAVYDECSLDQRFVLERAYRDRNIVNGAESLAVSWKSVMKTTADIESDAIAQRITGCQNAASCSQPERLHHLPRIWNLELQKFFNAQGSSL